MTQEKYPEGWMDDPIVSVYAKFIITYKRGTKVESSTFCFDGIKVNVASIGRELAKQPGENKI